MLLDARREGSGRNDGRVTAPVARELDPAAATTAAQEVGGLRYGGAWWRSSTAATAGGARDGGEITDAGGARGCRLDLGGRRRVGWQRDPASGAC